MKKICNKDCFNCPYEDCINDEMDHEDYQEAADRDRELFMTPEKRKIAAGKKAYYEANREKIAAGQKAYREANREAYNRYHREYARRKRHGSGDSV